jgi:hypothetical protein
MMADEPETPTPGVIVPEEAPAYEISVTLFVDNSGSMTDEGGIASGTDFQKRLVSELSLSTQADNSSILIRSLLFSDLPLWQQQSAVSVSQYEIEEAPVGKFSNFGAALKVALTEASQHPKGGRRVWIWIGDGYVTDEWLPQAELLRTDTAFRNIERYSVYPEGSIHRTALQWFAGAEDRVVPASAAERIFHDLTIGHSPADSETDDWDDDVVF